METRSIPGKNYIILGIVVLATFALLYYFVSFYNKQKDYENSIHTRMQFLSEVKENEIQNYILDNHDVIIYLSDSTDDTFSDFEIQLKSLMKDQNLTKNVVYMDVYKISSEENLKNILKLDTLIYPNVVIVTDEMGTSVLYKENQEKNPKEIVYYIQNYLEKE